MPLLTVAVHNKTFSAIRGSELTKGGQSETELRAWLLTAAWVITRAPPTLQIRTAQFEFHTLKSL